MSEVRRLLEEKQEELKHLTSMAENELKKAPKGNLRIAKQNGRPEYYHTLAEEKETHPNGRYISNQNQSLIRALAQKSYDKKLLKQCENSLSAIKKCLDQYDPEALRQVYENLGEQRQQLVNPLVLPDALYAKQWESVEYETRVFAPETPELFTEKGERVLSKSEKIIADKLHLMGIPYRYEAPLTISGNVLIHPDFTVLNVRTRKEYYWEHCGMMEDPDYANSTIKRIHKYINNGIIPGKQLILTFESINNPLDSRDVEEVAKAFLY